MVKISILDDDSHKMRYVKLRSKGKLKTSKIWQRYRVQFLSSDDQIIDILT